MTHEALAARFKEMEFVSSEQQQRKTLAPEQELRTNPIHHRHRTTDLRQYVHLQQHQQKQQQQQLDSGRNSTASSTAGSRRTSVDLGAASEDMMSSGAGGLLSRRGSNFGQHEGSPGSLGDNPAIEEESEDTEGDDQRANGEEFVTFGHQQHIYESDDIRPRGQSGHGSQSSERYEAGDPEWTQRRQEVVTVPAGMLSFFPSPEHSKRLETPQSISKLQNRMDSYNTGSLSSSSTGSGNSPRDTFQDRQGESSRSKGRAALSGETFQTPTSATLSGTPSSQSQSPLSSTTITSATGAGTAGATAHSRTSSRGGHPSTVRVHHQSYNSQNWSRMGETLVDDLLGAVRSKLQIARRMYDFSTFGFGTLGGNGYSKDNNDPPDLLRRTSSRGSRPRSQRNKEYRNSGSAIELDQAGVGSSIVGSMATKVAKTTMVHRMPSGVVDSNGLDSTSESHTSPRGVRRKPSAGSSSGGGHGRGTSSGSTTSVGGGSGGGSTRKRSLRSSNPINHPALMALVNELDKDKKEKEREEQEKKVAAAVVVDILSTSSS
ncbi:hypothetical protein BGZ95_005775 [Linnemannia exigua]|uniref:Uncharacterized protein n=1 Tax=Linnemannia exigua TaxID=604196 RepID=A0AAD4H8X3_9FUNG|nr:hypothetical protein BGZ95_005775 [Linnemannia exigua]